ncbi:hypothetical protein JCM3775_005807 [Rhodotorula graminis]
MPTKRTTTAVYASPARRPILRARKRLKTGSSSLAHRLDSDGDDHDAPERTDSDYEDLVEYDRDQDTRPASSRRRGRRSAPSGSTPAAGSGASSRAASTRRNSHAALAGSAAGPAGPSRARSTAARSRTEDASSAVVQHSRSRAAARAPQPLSPLPVNHSVERQQPVGRSVKGKERAADDGDADMLPVETTAARRTSAPPPQPGAGRVTRRTSSSGSGGNDAPLRRSRRASWATTEGGSEDEQEGNSDDDAHGGGSRSAAPRSSRLRRRRAALEDISDAGEAADEEAGDEKSPDASDAADGNDVDTKLHEWDAHHLEALLKSELVDLYHLARPASSSSHAVPRTKAELAQAIVEARYHSHSSGSNDEDAGDADGADSPHPRTSHEGSPADKALGTRRSRAPRRRIVLRRSGVRGQEPTPPPSDDSRDGDASSGSTSTGSASGDDTEIDESGPSSSTAPGASTRMTRRASQVEMPPPALPPAGAKRNMRTRSSMPGPGLSGSPRAKSARELALAVDPDGEGGTGATPVAHRTRHHGHVAHPPPQSPQHQRTALQLASGSPRPLRAAKRRAVARLADADGAATDSDEDEDEEMVDDADSGSGPGSDSHDASHSVEPRRPTHKVGGASGRRRPSRTAKQVETPPSDADEESGGEAERGADVGQEEERFEAKSHLRQAGSPRKSGGRLVKLRTTAEADEDEQMDEAGSGEEDGDTTVLDEAAEEDGQNDDGVDLAQATSTSLMRYKKDDLVRLCKERDLLDDENRTKAQLVDALLYWRDNQATEVSSPVSSPLSSSSTISNLSTQTARNETKTQALRGLEHASARTAAGTTPLLMRPEHLASPNKPQSAQHSKENEQQEDVNALDLESLQLRDKEIQPEELTKLELVGSGGFKDVFKGMLDGRTIAICDIRGHLTDMDIKELGLLRDLRHRNIVKFIGVSIPKQPSAVPVMIVTELCANGDLFDYLRKVPAPPFSAMLDLMLGIARGIEYLHKRKPTIIHRDIKSSNVLITGDGVPKIADFGLARIKTSTKSMMRSLVGTVNWQAPELWSPHPRYNEKVDVYSVGLVFWEILQWRQPVKRYPFEGQNEHAIYHDVGAKQLRPPAGPLRRQWGSEIIDLMTEMWDQDPTLRPSMGKVVAEVQRLVAAEKAKERAAKRAAQ